MLGLTKLTCPPSSSAAFETGRIEAMHSLDAFAAKLQHDALVISDGGQSQQLLQKAITRTTILTREVAACCIAREESFQSVAEENVVLSAEIMALKQFSKDGSISLQTAQTEVAILVAEKSALQTALQSAMLSVSASQKTISVLTAEKSALQTSAAEAAAAAHMAAQLPQPQLLSTSVLATLELLVLDMAEGRSCLNPSSSAIMGRRLSDLCSVLMSQLLVQALMVSPWLIVGGGPNESFSKLE